jgi:class 3 adenylate cyclase
MPLSLPVVFGLQSTMIAAMMAAIIVSMVIVTNKSIDTAVQASITNNLDNVNTAIMSFVDLTEASTRLGALLTTEFGDEGYKMQTAARPEAANFSTNLGIQMGMLMTNSLYGFTYQSYETTSGRWTDVGCGNATGYYYCTIGNQTAFDYVTEGTLPLDTTIVDSYERDATTDQYIVDIRAMTEAKHGVTGQWTSAYQYNDPEANAKVALVTYSVPMAYDATDGHTTLAFSIDIAVAWVGSFLQTLIKQKNLIYIVDLNDMSVLATSVPKSELTYANETDLEDLKVWTASNVPYAPIRKAVAAIVAEYAKQPGGIVASASPLQLEIDDHIVSVRHVSRNTLHWIAVDHTPTDFYFGESRRVMTILIVAASFVIVACVAVCVGVYFAVVTPLREMSANMVNVSRLDNAGESSVPVLSELQSMHNAFGRLDTAIQSFTRYVPRGVVRELMNTNTLCSLVMTPKRCSILFVDIESFTSICERVPVDELSRLVNCYFERMSGIVMQHEGMVDKYIGDCIMAVWSAPLEIDQHELRATLCALQLQYATTVEPLTSDFDSAGERLAIRTGVSAGEVLAGNMGCAQRMNYTVIGDPVNLAARVESLNKQFDTRVMITAEVEKAVRGTVTTRLLCKISVIGKAQPVEVFEAIALLGSHGMGDPTPISRRDSLTYIRMSGAYIADDELSCSTARGENGERVTVAALLSLAQHTFCYATQHEREFAAAYTAAVVLFNNAKFGDAVSALEAMEHEFDKSDTATKAFSQLHHRCGEYLLNPPGPDFNGTIVASDK